MPKQATMVKPQQDTNTEHRNRFMRFTPTMSMGNILTAVSILSVGFGAFVQYRIEITKLEDGAALLAATLASENSARKEEIKEAAAKADAERVEFYKKLAENQIAVHEEIKDLTVNMGSRFDRLEDKLDKKVDKR